MRIHAFSATVLCSSAALLLAALVLVGCNRPAAPEPVIEGNYFEQIPTTQGLPGPTPSWPDGTYATPEVTAGGVALLDYDNDGRLDVLQVCHGKPGHFDEHMPNRLYHQEADGTFREVPGAAGINSSQAGYCHGVAVGDYDNDGHVDVFITSYGFNQLYRNNGDGTFTNVTRKAGLTAKERRWCSSAAWLDYDRDGHLDLFVDGFAVFDPKRVCPGDEGGQEYCGPSQFDGIGARLYHNNGNGTFTDVTTRAGLEYPGRGWGVVCADLTGDGWPDIFVANDEERQNLWVNQHNGTFKDEAIERGVAYNGSGRPEAGMGVALGDVANDGSLSLFITHIHGEKNTLYRPRAEGYFSDVSAAAGMAAAGLTWTGWGCGFADLDNDGNLDLAIANGRVGRHPPLPGAQLSAFWNAYAENNLLLRGDGTGHFTYITPRGGDFTKSIESTRGLALGDLDNDGRIDLASNTIDNTLRVYRNVLSCPGQHWLLVRALTGKRDALGARVVVVAGERKWTRLIQSASSFCSSCDPRAHVGLGGIGKIDRIELTWPDGSSETFPAAAVDQPLVLHQGEGQRDLTRPSDRK